MVTFSCDGCGEMLKKNKVDAHARRCRECASVSCVDCAVSFWGDDYKTHTSCVSEAERYEKTVYKGPKKGGKGGKLSPQDAWLELIQRAVSNAPNVIKCYLEEISHLDNVPRKEKPFKNFAANSLRLRGNEGNKIIESIWKYLSQIRSQEQEKRKQLQDSNNSNSSHKSKNELSECEKIESEKRTEDEKPHFPKPPSSPQSSCENGIIDFSQPPDKNGNKKKKQRTEKELLKSIKKLIKKSPKRKMKIKELRNVLKTKKLITSKKKAEFRTIIQRIIERKKNKMAMDGKYIALES